MAYFRCGGGGIPAALKSDMNAVFNKKFETSTDYPPNTWADTVNLMGALPIRSASGTIATFNDGADTVPLKSLTLTITPSQSGTGDPSPTNPRPLNSFSSLTVEHTGKNFFDPSDYSSYEQADGSYSGLGSDFNSIYFYIPQELVGVQLTFSASIKIPEGSTITNPRVSARVNGTNTNGNAVTSNDYTLSSVTFTPTSTSDRLRITYGSNGSQPVQFKELLLETGSSATTYEEYRTPDPHTLDLGQTCYAVTGDAVTGEFEKTYERVKISSLNWTAQSNLSSLYTADLQGSIDTSKLVCCEFANGVPWDNVWANIPLNSISVASSGNVFFKTTDYATTEDFLQDWGDYYLCYPLATPTALTIDPVEVESFKGGNNIWCDKDNSSVAVEYRADIDLLITELGG